VEGKQPQDLQLLGLEVPDHKLASLDLEVGLSDPNEVCRRAQEEDLVPVWGEPNGGKFWGRLSKTLRQGLAMERIC